MSTPVRRLLLVHAHPDDETIGTGVTMARYAAEGAQVTLLTCTLGELGEILLPELAELAADRGDQLGGYRLGELATAMRALGVSDHRFLGGPGRWRDSGMVGTTGNQAARAFCRCASDETAFDIAVSSVVEVIREVRPQVLMTYDANGGYGHPDHITAHLVSMAAVDRGDGWPVEKVYHIVGKDDAAATTAIEGSRWLSAKRAAMQAHATQITVDGSLFALSNNVRHDLASTEYFQLVRGPLGADRDAAGREVDLFDGLTP